MQPDLRTLEGALHFLGYLPATPETLPKHEAVNAAFKELLCRLWTFIPEGPGKTRWLHALSAARMQANSAIATEGA
jgi:hypothetical protein